VITIAETGRANQQMSDEEVLAFAASDGRAAMSKIRGSMTDAVNQDRGEF
jgi:hypothetical protein